MNLREKRNGRPLVPEGASAKIFYNSKWPPLVMSILQSSGKPLQKKVAPFCHYLGTTLAPFWHHLHTMLAPCWHHVDTMLDFSIKHCVCPFTKRHISHLRNFWNPALPWKSRHQNSQSSQKSRRRTMPYKQSMCQRKFSR